MPKAQASAASRAQGNSLDTDECYQRYQQGHRRRGQYHRWPRLKPWTITKGVFDIPIGEVFCRAEVRRGVLCENSRRWSQPVALRGHVKREHSHLAALPVGRRGRPSVEENYQTSRTYYELLSQIDEGSLDSDIKDEIVVKILPDTSSDDDEEEFEAETEDGEEEEVVGLPADFNVGERLEDRGQNELNDGIELHQQSESEEYHTAVEEDYYTGQDKIGPDDYEEESKIPTTKERMRKRVKFTKQSESEPKPEEGTDDDEEEEEEEEEKQEEEDKHSTSHPKNKTIPKVWTLENSFDPPFDRNKVWIPKPNRSILQWEPRSTTDPKRALRLKKILESLSDENEIDVDYTTEEAKKSAPSDLRKRKPSPPKASLPKAEEKIIYWDYYKKPKLDLDKESEDCEGQKTSSSENYWLSRTGQPTPPVETEGTRQTIYASRDS